MGQQEAPGETEEAKTATGAVNSQWSERRSLGPPYLHLRRHHGWKIEQTFKDVKEVWGAGQQQVRNLYSNEGCFNLNLWMYSLVEMWACSQEEKALVDRAASPWDSEPRRPSHQDKRKALQREVCRPKSKRLSPDGRRRREFGN